MLIIRDRQEAELLALYRSLDAKGQALFVLLMLSVRQQAYDQGPAPSLPVSAEQAPPIVRLFRQHS